MIKFEFLGTGSSSQVPVYNCSCIACQRAVNDSRYIRRPASAVISDTQGKWLIDSGRMDLTILFAPQALKGIFQTHYHADHAQGLLQLRWGVNVKIPVYGPIDEVGFADLYKHPGILDFQAGFEPFDIRNFGDFSMMALPLEHSKPTVGYLLSTPNGENLVYLTDTIGLREDVLQFLGAIPLKYAVIDCSYPPATEPRNHNDLTMALSLLEVLGAEQSFLTHIDHKLDAYLIENPDVLPEHIALAQDGMSVILR
ncbi:phosphonate metabolism protein PhnP [Pelistega ratti]|uniref:phosphonate metabolism protein PhnP n=1 Tax=Pelistega ratti TaxID=2652177 RepID=UPI001915E638|nr:phosphonate metabolism protein PhnP [Pelistega ratti]